MRRLKLYLWSVIAITSVIFIACEMQDLKANEFVTSKLIAFFVLIYSARNISKYKDVMEKDIEKLEDLIVPDEPNEKE